MRILVTYGSKLGGTKGIAEQIGGVLEESGLDVTVQPVEEPSALEGYDAVVVGGGLYAGRWPRPARQFVKQHAAELRSRPVWFFSSGPLDDSAAGATIPPTPAVDRLIEAVGARGHVTFGGRLAPDAKGFIASRMARKHSGDWRDAGAIRGFATEIAAKLALSAAEPPGAQDQGGWHGGRDFPRS
jgi:menaquinone-dependent protoporphyrinogen oxidase